jgi:hypothetical protein
VNAERQEPEKKADDLPPPILKSIGPSGSSWDE